MVHCAVWILVSPLYAYAYRIRTQLCAYSYHIQTQPCAYAYRIWAHLCAYAYRIRTPVLIQRIPHPYHCKHNCYRSTTSSKSRTTASTLIFYTWGVFGTGYTVHVKEE